MIDTCKLHDDLEDFAAGFLSYLESGGAVG